MPEQDRKLRELILYLAKNSASDRSFGRTKLNKLLFFCDFLAFRAWGAAVTGARYFKLPFGPVPKAVNGLLPQMEAEGLCREIEVLYFGLPQRVLEAQRDPDTTLFAQRELQLIDDVLEALRHSNASEVSNLSHQFIGWQAMEFGDEIPYETVYCSAPRPLHPWELDAVVAAAAAL